MTTRKRPFRTNLLRSELGDATLAELLHHGIATAEDDPIVGVLVRLRNDIEATAELTGDDERLIAETLWGYVRRIDVVLELMARRERRRRQRKVSR